MTKTILLFSYNILLVTAVDTEVMNSLLFLAFKGI